MKQTNQSLTGTGYNNISVLASLNEFTKVLGKPIIHNDPDSWCTHEWQMELEDGNVFSVYDWMREEELKGTTKIKWHIGSKTVATALEAREKILEAIIQL